MIEHPFILLILFPIASYLIGAIPFGVLIARFHGVNLQTQGSGNVGATNCGRVLGRKWGLLCFFLDVMKGLAPVLVATTLVRNPNVTPQAMQQAAILAVGFGAIMGHVFSVYLRFKGGKGVATSLGVVLGVWPYYTLPALCAFGLWILLTAITRYVSLGSIVAAAGFVVFFGIFNYSQLQQLWPMGAFAALMTLLIVFRHRSNIQRLIAGTESKIHLAKKKPLEENPAATRGDSK